MTYILKKKLNYNISELIEGLTEVSLFFYCLFTVFIQFEHLKTCYTIIKGGDSMEYESQKIRTGTSGYCTVEDGIIYEINPLYAGQKQRVGVTDSVYNELKSISEEYYNKLVELGAIVPPKTPEQIQAETMQMMSSMLAEMKSMKQEMEELKNERRNSSTTAGNEPAKYTEADTGMGTGTEGLAGGKQSSRSKKSD